jgi:hypothetical protein
MSSFLAAIVYGLCALTSLACTLLLARGYLRTRVRLLMWSSLFFAALTVDNIILFFDLSVFPDMHLVLWRHLATLLGMALMFVGLIWDSE